MRRWLVALLVMLVCAGSLAGKQAVLAPSDRIYDPDGVARYLGRPMADVPTWIFAGYEKIPDSKAFIHLKKDIGGYPRGYVGLFDGDTDKLCMSQVLVNEKGLIEAIVYMERLPLDDAALERFLDGYERMIATMTRQWGKPAYQIVSDELTKKVFTRDEIESNFQNNVNSDGFKNYVPQGDRYIAEVFIRMDGGQMSMYIYYYWSGSKRFQYGRPKGL